MSKLKYLILEMLTFYEHEDNNKNFTKNIQIFNSY